MFTRILNPLLLAMSLSMPALAFDSPRVSVMGSGEVRAYPNQADIVLEAETVRPRMKQAMDETQAAIRGGFAVCSRYASDSSDLSAGQVSVEKDYKWVKNTQVFQGYRATQSLTLRLKDLRRLGALMEDFSEGKITRISGIWYGHSSLDSLEREAEAKALANARLSAEKLCLGLGGTLGDAIEVTNYPPVQGESPAEGFASMVSRAASRAEYKSKQEYLVKPDLIRVQGLVHGTFLLRPAKSTAPAKG